MTGPMSRQVLYAIGFRMMQASALLHHVDERNNAGGISLLDLEIDAEHPIYIFADSCAYKSTIVSLV